MLGALVQAQVRLAAGLIDDPLQALMRSSLGAPHSAFELLEAELAVHQQGSKLLGDGEIRYQDAEVRDGFLVQRADDLARAARRAIAATAAGDGTDPVATAACAAEKSRSRARWSRGRCRARAQQRL